jgi:CRISPR/Cas system endoribonuclease Cas6 (RAMP superfamily)
MDDRLRVEDDLLTIPAQNKTYRIYEAVRFIACASSAGDPLNLIKRVRTKDQLEKMHCELFGNSVISGDHAYDVEPGFFGILLADAEALAPVTQPSLRAAPSVTAENHLDKATAEVVPAPEQKTEEAGNGKTEMERNAELLTKFLLGGS